MEKTLYKVKYQQLKMLQSQGYDTEEESSLPYFKKFGEEGMLEEFIDADHILNRRYTSEKGEEPKYCYYINSKPAKKHIEAMVKTVQDTRIIIIISEKSIGIVVLRELFDLTEQGYRFVTFKFEELTFDIFENFLVPRHKLLSRGQVRNFVNATKLSLDQLARIHDKDPAIKRIDGKPGDVVKIYRRTYLHNSIVRNTIVYKLVIYTLPESEEKISKKGKIKI
uniref:DNA-directed RNA polymerase subunit 5 n=1 Tax=Pithovirus LCPAC403 TaxID=2506596 RepID=A0A481ZDK6_9VIRU|nr:MAG: DNA-directed RNA polymerase subunit 5 [Pithovirus LCPAC403]